MPPCAEAGFTVAAEHIDHIEPAHLAPERFWDRDNVQPICRQCHERKHAYGGCLTPEQVPEERLGASGWLSTRSEPELSAGTDGRSA